MRKWLPAVAGIGVFTVTVLLWHGLLVLGHGELDKEIELQIATNAMLTV